MKFILLLVLSSYSSISLSQPSQNNISLVLHELNSLRSNGCKCGSEMMKPAKPLIWNNTLYNVSRDYAHYLYNNRIFSHVSKDGKTLGDRLDQIGYNWNRIGENLGRGYDDFYSVLRAWIASPSHCKMLMDPHVTEIGMSKHYDYWVQSFSSPNSNPTY